MYLTYELSVRYILRILYQKTITFSHSFFAPLRFLFLGFANGSRRRRRDTKQAIKDLEIPLVVTERLRLQKFSTLASPFLLGSPLTISSNLPREAVETCARLRAFTVRSFPAPWPRPRTRSSARPLGRSDENFPAARCARSGSLVSAACF